MNVEKELEEEVEDNIFDIIVVEKEEGHNSIMGTMNTHVGDR